jgi:hypothetical protein
VNLDAVRNFRFAPVSHSYTRRDTMLYALGLGYGSDPLDPDPSYASSMRMASGRSPRSAPCLRIPVLGSGAPNLPSIG